MNYEVIKWNDSWYVYVQLQLKWRRYSNSQGQEIQCSGPSIMQTWLIPSGQPLGQQTCSCTREWERVTMKRSFNFFVCLWLCRPCTEYELRIQSIWKPACHATFPGEMFFSTWPRSNLIQTNKPMFTLHVCFVCVFVFIVCFLTWCLIRGSYLGYGHLSQLTICISFLYSSVSVTLF